MGGRSIDTDEVIDLEADVDIYRRFGRQVAEQCRRLGVNPNELDKRGVELAERAARTVRTLA